MIHCVIRQLKKSFIQRTGIVPVLDGIDLEIRAGQFVALLGPSGCGKTTLLRILAGLEEPSAGEVLVDDEPVRGPRADMGMVSQTYSLFPWLTVRQNIAFGLKLRARSWSEALDHTPPVSEILDLIGLQDFAEAYPATLSGGMKQRVALARSLILRPQLLLLDEPLAALDSPTRIILQEQIADLTSALSTTACLVTHDAEEALYLADTIYLLAHRPAHVREVIDNAFECPRDFGMRSSPIFQSRKQKLVRLIREETGLLEKE